MSELDNMYKIIKSSLSDPTKKELFDGRVQEDRDAYQKVIDLISDVSNDPKSRLPFVPTFYELGFGDAKTIEKRLIKFQETRIEEFCLKRCVSSENTSCLSINRITKNLALNSAKKLLISGTISSKPSTNHTNTLHSLSPRRNEQSDDY